MLNANQKISQQILLEIGGNGGDIEQAIDTVIGAGAYAKLVGDVYIEMQTNAAANG